MPLKMLTAAVMAAVLFGPALAEPVIAQGSASLDAGVPAAREMAIQDALHQAALTKGARVESGQYMNSGVVSESTSLSAAPLAGRVTVLDEKVQDGLYQVRIQVDTQDGPLAPEGCALPGGRTLRRRVIAANFSVDQPGEAEDLDSLGVRLPHELATRLARYGNVIGARDAGNVTVMPNPFLTDPTLGANSVRRLALEQDEQFVVAGRVLSTAVTDRSPRFTWFGSSMSSQQGSYYNGPFSTLTGGAVQYRAVARQFDMELWIYDGLTGALLSNQRLTTLAHGDVVPATPPPFASAAFWGTDYGKSIDQLLNQAVDRISQTVSCIPYSTRVMRVTTDGQLYLDAGGMDGLQVGDKLLIYRPRINAAIQSPGSGDTLGESETLLGDISVIQVQPQLSIAVAQSVRGSVQEGDLVRFIPKR